LKKREDKLNSESNYQFTVMLQVLSVGGGPEHDLKLLKQRRVSVKMYIGVGFNDGQVRQVECNPESLKDMAKIIWQTVHDEVNARTFEISIQLEEDEERDAP